MPAPAPSFLTARWENLAMANYEVDPSILRERVPRETELDFWGGRCFVSVVGFQFLDTRVLGVGVPFHRDFPEVNLRFYVRREAGGEVRRGVVFVKEIVPRRALAWIANALYGENYVALPMTHTAPSESSRGVAYGWRHAGESCRLAMTLDGDPYLPDEASEESFITEHYWGYARQRDGSTVWWPTFPSCTGQPSHRSSRRSRVRASSPTGPGSSSGAVDACNPRSPPLNPSA